MTESHKNRERDSNSLVLRLIAMTAAMFAFGFLLVPLYDAFCEITGLGGRTNDTAVVVEDNPDANREVALEFVTTVNAYAPWEFSAQADGMTVHPGGLYEATFVARNLTDRAQVAQAIPSVAPPQAAKHFKKLDCFCFTTQEFAANEKREMFVRFVVDSDLPDYIDTITLSYTFFDVAALSDTPSQAALSNAHP